MPPAYSRYPCPVGIRPADVCGCVRNPRPSSSASSFRTVEAETLRLPRSTGYREPTGWPVATYSSITSASSSRWRSLRFAIGSEGICRNFSCASSEPVCGQPAAENPAPLRERKRQRVALDETEAFEPKQSLPVQDTDEPSEHERLRPAAPPP